MPIFGRGSRQTGPQPTSMNRSDKGADPVYRKPTDREIRNYAKRLQASDRKLTWEQAMSLANEHVIQHLEAHLKYEADLKLQENLKNINGKK